MGSLKMRGSEYSDPACGRQEGAALGHKMTLGGSVLVLDVEKSPAQNKSTGRRTSFKDEDGQSVMYLWLPSKEEDAREETWKVLRGNRFAILATDGEEVFTRRA